MMVDVLFCPFQHFVLCLKCRKEIVWTSRYINHNEINGPYHFREIFWRIRSNSGYRTIDYVISARAALAILSDHTYCMTGLM